MREGAVRREPSLNAGLAVVSGQVAFELTHREKDSPHIVDELPGLECAVRTEFGRSWSDLSKDLWGE